MQIKSEVMASNTTFCLKSSKFPELICQSLKVLRSGQDFADVTLACEDGKTTEAHKFILAGGSPFFAGLFKKLTNPHPLIYLKDVSMESLLSVLDFMYTGQAEVSEEGMEDLLSLADHLEIVGLRADKGEEMLDNESKGAIDTTSVGRYQDGMEKIVKREKLNDPWENTCDDKTDDVAQISNEAKQSRRDHADPEHAYINRQKDSKFGSASENKKHIKRSIDKSGSFVKCDQCDQILTSRKLLNRHIKKQHNKQK